MNIALVSKTNGCVGGASFFAENIGGWLREAGHEITQFCVAPGQELRPFQRRFNPAGPVSRLVRHVNWRMRQWGMFEPFPWEYWFGLRAQLDRFDLIHFHDLHRAISPRTLACVARKKPVFLTVHDCSAFTGGCLYPMECKRFRTSCGECPRLPEIGPFDFTRSNLERNRQLARSPAVHYVFPSRWIGEEASRSLPFGGRATHIPNGFDFRPYNFQERHQAKTILGLAPEKKVVAICAASLDDHRKGIGFALNAIAACRALNPTILLVGQASFPLDQHLSGMNYLLAGFVADRTRLGLFYAAADLLLFPSLADNLPITIQEAMAAGTPVLAFAVGGVPELVRPGRTGWLVAAGDQAALNRQLREILQADETWKFGECARTMIQDEFSVAGCVNRHVTLYRTALDAAASQRRNR